MGHVIHDVQYPLNEEKIKELNEHGLAMYPAMIVKDCKTGRLVHLQYENVPRHGYAVKSKTKKVIEFHMYMDSDEMNRC